jgi:DNA polymerase II large subunit
MSTPRTSAGNKYNNKELTRSETRKHEDNITQHITDPKQQLEVMIKKGITGLELIEWVQETYHCSKEDALAHVADTAKESASIIKKLFDENHVIMMSFDLYNRAVAAGKIRDAALILQTIIDLLGHSVNPVTKQGLNVEILEMLPEKNEPGTD